MKSRDHPASPQSDDPRQDSSWSTVGSANIGRLHLRGADEINLEIHDEHFGSDKFSDVDSRNCRALTLEEWQVRHLLARFSGAVLVPLRPLL